MSGDQDISSGPSGFPDESQDWRDLEPELLRIVRAELGPRLRARLESMDVVQDVLGEVAQSRESFDAEKCRNFRAWLERVVRNRICNLADYHGAGRRDIRRETHTGLPPDEFAASTPSTHDEVVARLDHRRLLRSLGELPEAQRTVILLRNLEGVPWSDVATMTGAPSADAARMLYSRAVVALTRLFSRACED